MRTYLTLTIIIGVFSIVMVSSFKHSLSVQPHHSALKAV